MARAQKPSPSSSLTSPGAVDLHFHGAFGIDLMTAPEREMERLSKQLWEKGVAAFCATTLSVPPAELLDSVQRMGSWIRNGRAPGARPLGIHLEGPFISPGACGAHPPDTIRPLDFAELDRLWEGSRETLKILTIAPEQLAPDALRRLVRWSKDRGIVLSLGHSRATEEQAHQAFRAGFTGVTHAWNALSFHHRAPGALGAALGNPKVYSELILDQVHVAPTLIRWTIDLHPKGTCFVSDCVPAAGTRSGTWHRFGSLKIQFQDGACRLPEGHLAGGGILLPEAYRRWVTHETRHGRWSADQVKSYLRKTLPALTTRPLEALGFSAKTLEKRRLFWHISSEGKLTYRPV